MWGGRGLASERGRPVSSMPGWSDRVGVVVTRDGWVVSVCGICIVALSRPPSGQIVA